MGSRRFDVNTTLECCDVDGALLSMNSRLIRGNSPSWLGFRTIHGAGGGEHFTD